MSEYENFIKTIEEYYGDYRPAVKGLLLAYLKKEIKPEYLKQLFSLVIKDFSNQYKTPPDIAIFNKYLNDVNYNKYFAGSSLVAQIENKTSISNEEIENLFNKVHEKIKYKS